MISVWHQIIFGAFLRSHVCIGSDHVTVELSVDKAIASVAPEYLSFNIDAGSWRGHKFLTSKVLDLLVSQLTPAHLRIGGTQGDYDVYNVGPDGQTCENLPEPMTPYMCREVTEDAWRSLLAFSSRNHLSLIYGLNDMFGRPTKTSAEDPLCIVSQGCPERNLSNIASLLNWTAATDAVLYGLELGNELNSVLDGTIGAQQQASDFAALQDLCAKIWSGKKSSQSPKLIGPDLHSWSEYKPEGLQWFADFVNASAGTVDALTFHMYSMGDGSKLDASNLQASFLNPDALDKSRLGVRALANITQPLNRELWGGETSSVVGGGAENITDTFINGFWYLDQLGSHAQEGVKVFQRQTLIATENGNRYEMIYEQADGSLQPLPDYWLAALHKQLMGTQVFATLSSSPDIRVYCHCAAQGGISVAIINLGERESAVNFVSKGGDSGSSSIQYILQAGQRITGAISPLQSKEVLLNGVSLQLLQNTTEPRVPNLRSMGKAVSDTRVIMPPTSYGFIHMDRAKVSICEESTPSGDEFFV